MSRPRTGSRDGDPSLTLGAIPAGGERCGFRVWAPRAEQVEVHLLQPADRLVPLEPTARGYHEAVIDDVPVGSRYLYRLDRQRERPDPASRAQPDGVHRASAVVDTRFPWTDEGWAGRPLADHVIYELHVGTFTRAGTFEAVIPQLDALADLGVTALELMPVAQFSGARNWGYDGVYPFAAQSSYGGARGLARLVDACHARGLAVVLDVVHNHLGPEGNYLSEFGPYFTDRYRTSWGEAINFDGPHSDEVRRFFVESALYWQAALHIDALRLDAVHAIRDFSAVPFLEQLGCATRAQAARMKRRFFLIAESDLNDARLVRPRSAGGVGLDAQWSDDVHHALHTLLTGERAGYYADFGELTQLARALRDGWTYQGQRSSYRQRRHGNSPEQVRSDQLVICAQNHDQVGNRMLGERLTALVGFEALKLAAGATILSPFIPLLFMGEEHGEPAPFPYFVSHGDPGLVEAVREGRRAEFAAFGWQGAPPDPQDEATFASARVDHALREQGQHRVLRSLYRELLRLRRAHAALRCPSKERQQVHVDERARVIWTRRFGDDETLLWLLCFADAPQRISVAVDARRWALLLDSAAPRFAPDAADDGAAEDTPRQLAAKDGVLALTLAPSSFALFAAERSS